MNHTPPRAPEQKAPEHRSTPPEPPGGVRRWQQFAHEHVRGWHIALGSSLLTMTPFLIGKQNTLLVLASLACVVVVAGIVLGVRHVFARQSPHPPQPTDDLYKGASGFAVFLLSGTISLFATIFEPFAILILILVVAVSFMWRYWARHNWKSAAQDTCVIILFGIGLAFLREQGIFPFRPERFDPTLQVQSNTPSVRPSARRTLEYWQKTVVPLHKIHFEQPAANESTSLVAERFVENVSREVDRAKRESIIGVDADLVGMVRRHLALDDRALRLMQRIRQLLQQEGFPRDEVPIDQRITEWDELLEWLRANPDVAARLPEDLQNLIAEILEVQQSEGEQLHEIEIMQAVLQERFRGTKFPLPAIAQ